MVKRSWRKDASLILRQTCSHLFPLVARLPLAVQGACVSLNVYSSIIPSLGVITMLLMDNRSVGAAGM